MLEKQLIKFSFNQLINLNIHLGIKQEEYWTPLAFFLVSGLRQNYYFLNLNLTVLNLRNGFNLIKLLLKNNYKILFFNNNFILNKLIFQNYQIFKQFKIFFGLGSWVNGFLSNFKTFKSRIKFGFHCLKTFLKKIIFKKFFKINKSKLWNFFLFLKSMKYLPSALFLMEPNHFAIFETLKLNIFSISVVDINKPESVYLSINYLIPFNYFNFSSLLFLFRNIKYLFILDMIKKKKFFFFLIRQYLLKKLKNIFKYIKNINLFFSVFLNIKRFQKKKPQLKHIKLFKLLNYKLII